MSMISAYLKRLSDSNARADHSPPEHSPPLHASQIATLHPGHFRAATPMLQQRFDFCGAWRQAALQQDWLDPAQMRLAWSDPVIEARLALRRDEGTGIVASVPSNRLSLFAFSPARPDETYLVWPEQTGDEPALHLHSHHQTHEFANLRDFLAWLVETR